MSQTCGRYADTSTHLSTETIPSWPEHLGKESHVPPAMKNLELPFQISQGSLILLPPLQASSQGRTHTDTEKPQAGSRPRKLSETIESAYAPHTQPTKPIKTPRTPKLGTKQTESICSQLRPRFPETLVRHRRLTSIGPSAAAQIAPSNRTVPIADHCPICILQLGEDWIVGHVGRRNTPATNEIG